VAEIIQRIKGLAEEFVFFNQFKTYSLRYLCQMKANVKGVCLGEWGHKMAKNPDFSKKQIQKPMDTFFR